MKKAEIIKCHCGSIRAACTAPECYTDEDWHRQKVKYIMRGYEVDTIEFDSKNPIEFEKCKCEKIPELFGDQK